MWYTTHGLTASATATANSIQIRVNIKGIIVSVFPSSNRFILYTSTLMFDNSHLHGWNQLTLDRITPDDMQSVERKSVNSF